MLLYSSIVLVLILIYLDVLPTRQKRTPCEKRTPLAGLSSISTVTVVVATSSSSSSNIKQRLNIMRHGRATAWDLLIILFVQNISVIHVNR